MCDPADSDSRCDHVLKDFGVPFGTYFAHDQSYAHRRRPCHRKRTSGTMLSFLALFLRTRGSGTDGNEGHADGSERARTVLARGFPPAYVKTTCRFLDGVQSSLSSRYRLCLPRLKYLNVT